MLILLKSILENIGSILKKYLVSAFSVSSALIFIMTSSSSVGPTAVVHPAVSIAKGPGKMPVARGFAFITSIALSVRAK